MSDTNHDRLCRLLHSYELGLLEGDQLDEFEQHIIDCPDCRAQAEAFLPAAHLLKHDPEIRGLVEGLQPPEGETKRRGFWPAFVAVAAIVLVLILRPWNLQFQPTQEVIASENRLAILYIGALSDSEETAGLGQAAAGLLIADLSESQFLRVVSSQRMYDAARRLGLPDPNRIDQNNAAAVAREVGARWMLAASLIGDGSGQRLVTQLYDVATGEVEASQNVAVDSSTSVFALVDQLSVQLKSDLGLPDQALKEPDPHVADVTSHSVEAYKYYLKGIELRQRMYLNEATDCFHKAAMIDSAFAMAYYYLSLSQNSRIIEKAVMFASRATKKEQMFIAARAAQVNQDTATTASILRSITEQYPDEKDAFYQLGQYYFGRLDYGRGVFYLEKSLALDPLHRVSYNQLAYCYSEMGKLDEALRTLDDYQKIAPDEPNPLDSRADILAANGRLKDAIDTYAQAVAKYPDFSPSQIKLYYAYLTDGQYERAEEVRLGWEKDCVSYGCANAYWAKSSALCLRGRYRDGLVWIDRAIDADREIAEKKGFSQAEILHGTKAQMLMAMDSSALAEIALTLEYVLKVNPEDRINYRISLVRALIHENMIDSAAHVVEQLRRESEDAPLAGYTYRLARGYLEYGRNDYASAIASFDTASMNRSKNTSYPPALMLGQALVLAGQAARAVEVLSVLEKSYTENRIKDVHGSSRLCYYLARAYEASGRIDSATAKYQKFLGMWENADPDLTEYVDARARLTRLKTNP